MEVLLNLMGGVALLLWGIRMVRTGIMRAFGSEIRRAISATADKRITAFLAGIGVTGVLQSSTATSLIVASFAARNVIAGSVAIAILLGADVGTTLVVQLLSQRIGWISPLLFVAGVVGFLSTERNKQRSFSRALIGLGLVLLSLQLLIAASEPLRTSESLSVLLDRLGDEPVLAILIAALLTVLTHSSVAVVLLIASLATTGAVEPTMSLLLVLGANLGSAMLPVMA
ncbi:MAG: Na/Pi symporter, partial [Hyphomicrobiaceae bacterium]